MAADSPPRSETSPPAGWEQMIYLAQDWEADPASFTTPPESPQKPSDATPSPFKEGEAALKGVKVNPSKVSPGTGDTIAEGMRALRRRGIDPAKARELGQRFTFEFDKLIKGGEDSDSPEGHRNAVDYARNVGWVEETLREIHDYRDEKGYLLFDIVHIVEGENKKGKHFFTPEEFDENVKVLAISTQNIRLVIWKKEEGDEPKRSSVFPDELTPQELIPLFKEVPAAYWSGNRSLRQIKGVWTESYHQGYLLRSAFPLFYFSRLKEGETHTVVEGRAFTTEKILTCVKEMSDDFFYPKLGPNPLQFYNKERKTCVVGIASKLGIEGVDTGVCFEIPEEMLVPTYISTDDFEELIADISSHKKMGKS